MPKNSYSKKGKRHLASQRGSRRRERRLSIRSELRREPDVRKIARAVVALAMAQAEQEAAAQQEQAARDRADQEPADE